MIWTERSPLDVGRGVDFRGGNVDVVGGNGCSGRKELQENKKVILMDNLCRADGIGVDGVRLGMATDTNGCHAHHRLADSLLSEPSNFDMASPTQSRS